MEDFHERRGPIKGLGKPFDMGEYCDPSGERLIREMDAAGIDHSVVFPLDVGLLLGEPPVSIRKQNELLADVARRYPSRITAFFGVDPRRPGAVEWIEAGIREWGMGGVKFHPGSGFHLSREEFFPVLERIADLGVPLVTHTGPAFGPLDGSGCDPMELDKALGRIPGLKIVAAHLGGGRVDELCWLGTMKENLYADISLRQLECRRNPEAFAETLRKALDFMGPDRILFGTDWPFSRKAMAAREYVRALRELSRGSSAVLLSGEIKRLLGGNALRLLGKKGEALQRGYRVDT